MSLKIVQKVCSNTTLSKYLQQVSLAARATIYRRLRALRARNRKKSLKKSLYGVGVCKKVPENARKSQDFAPKVRLGYFQGLFCRPPKRLFLAISGPEGQKTPVNGRSSRKVSHYFQGSRRYFWEVPPYFREASHCSPQLPRTFWPLWPPGLEKDSDALAKCMNFGHFWQNLPSFIALFQDRNSTFFYVFSPVIGYERRVKSSFSYDPSFSLSVFPCFCVPLLQNPQG